MGVQIHGRNGCLPTFLCLRNALAPKARQVVFWELGNHAEQLRPTKIWATANDGDTLDVHRWRSKRPERQMAFILSYLFFFRIINLKMRQPIRQSTGIRWNLKVWRRRVPLGSREDPYTFFDGFSMLRYWSLGSKPSKPRLSQTHEKVNRPLNSILLMSIFVMFCLGANGCSTICKR